MAIEEASETFNSESGLVVRECCDVLDNVRSAHDLWNMLCPLLGRWLQEEESLVQDWALKAAERSVEGEGQALVELASEVLVST